MKYVFLVLCLLVLMGAPKGHRIETLTTGLRAVIMLCFWSVVLFLVGTAFYASLR